MKFLLFFGPYWDFCLAGGHPDGQQQKFMVEAVNKIRAKGCHCGKRFMEPVPTIEWNEKLYKSAWSQATEMKEYNFFAHYSKEGLNIGERLEKAGYNWMVAGENLGEGQKSFEEVLDDWLKSYSHCTMLMHPKVNEMAVAKVDKYWVQHFGKQMPSRK
ncbi:MAG: CAP domain-containing protein [Saprospiraceae bacterium]|nr:CAP domain-containing protein [Saprospiraceae bacterium]